MRLLILTAVVFFFNTVAHSETVSCSAEQISNDAQEVGKKAVSGQPVTLTPCLTKTLPPKKLKPVASKTTNSQPLAQAPKEDNQQMMSTVVSPIVIVTGTAPQPPLPAKVEEPVRVVEKPVIVYRQAKPIVKTVRVHGPQKKNKIFIMGGIGPTGSRTFVDSTNQTIRSTTEHNGLFGIQYDRNVSGDVMLGLTVLSNTTATLNLGYEF